MYHSNYYVYFGMIMFFHDYPIDEYETTALIQLHRSYGSHVA